MKGAFMALQTGILALPLLAGPWLSATGSLLIWQAITGEPVGDLRIRLAAVGLGGVCIVWTIHSIVSGVDRVRNWWLMFCSLMNLLAGVAAVFQPSDPDYLQYVMVPMSLAWSIWLFLTFFKRRRAVKS